MCDIAERSAFWDMLGYGANYYYKFSINEKYSAEIPHQSIFLCYNRYFQRKYSSGEVISYL